MKCWSELKKMKLIIAIVLSILANHILGWKFPATLYNASPAMGVEKETNVQLYHKSQISKPYLSRFQFQLGAIGVSSFAEKPKPRRKTKDDNVIVQGKVIDVLSNSQFRVEIEPSKAVVLCTLAGKLKKNFVRVVAEDNVDVELSIYDTSKGRIVYRNK